KPFLAGAEERGLLNLQGHRSGGGMRYSIYNAVPEAAVDALVAYLAEFYRQHGCSAMSEEVKVKALRNRIDAIDEKVLELISERARCAQVVAEVKQKTLAEGEQPVFYRPEREAQVLKRIMELNKGPLDNEEVARLFREIMSACLAL